ncbi:WD repeat-containing protein 54-like [Acipenser oxyrinchus oxyrinchus]|uniref:WD repeat-containing protein 54-like n=1 Tax=Acipenser oxyrinchus oxyrinchus TaxID=40147 RepID=A0AAD8GL50_ACIOX|nr:WD repeat-containing protein 54-like [Acipenser oxyrinchus oxyrinchus]KAK1176627.1 WD repeat-containing protein 54-like [Acipenser oxyrinchus oxyrinchus]
MYRREKSIQIKSSASALYNNLSVLPIAEKSLTYFTVVHCNVVNMVSASGDGLNFSHRQLQSKEGSIATSSSLIIQASWCVLPSRVLLVLTSQKGIQMYESDGSIMVYWHALDIPETPSAEAVFARGIAAATTLGHYICVGTSSGSVLVFKIPDKGANIILSEVLEEHRDPITDIATETSSSKEYIADIVSADDSGLLCIWKAGEDFKLLNKIPAYGCSCSSVKLWCGIVIAGYGSGQIRLYDALSGVVYAEVNAHARWIYALDIAPDSGKLLSGAEDSLVRIWKLSKSPESHTVEIEHQHTECVTDVQICGAKFCDPEGSAFAVTGYDLSEIIRYTVV